MRNINIEYILARLRLQAVARNRITLAVALLLLAGTGIVNAQDTTNADGLFEKARKTANDDKNFPEAIRLGKKALLISPGYTDITIFVGRVYTWNKQPDSGRVYFQNALKSEVKYEDAYAAWSDLEFWNNNNEQALSIAGQGLSVFHYSQELLMRKAKILASMKAYKAAILVTDTLLVMNRHNAEARALNVSMKDLSYMDRFAVKYDYAHFDKQFVDDWYYGSLEYTRLTGVGPFVARINYADRYKRDGLQFEADAYPHLSRTFYMYLNVGFSNHTEVFAKWRSGASLFANLPLAFEAEAGVRYLRYTSDIFFYTGYAGKYFSNFLVGARTYIAPSATAVSNANSILVRYYYGGKDDYVSLTAGAGISPDDRRQNLLLNSSVKLRSYTGELVWRMAIRKLNVVSLNISLLNQEYLPGIIGNQMQAGFGYIRHF